MSVGVDSRYAVQMNRCFLRLIGVWPLASDARLVARLLRKVSTTTTYCCISFMLFPCALHAILEEPNPAIKIKLIGPINFNVMAMTKHFCLVNGMMEIEECLRHIEDDWTFYKERKAEIELSIMRKKAKIGRTLTLLCASFMFGGSTFYHTIMRLSAGRVATSAALKRLAQPRTSNSTDLDTRLPRHTTHPVYERYMNVQDSPWFEIVCLSQYFCAMVTCTVTVGVCGLAAAYVVHVCAQLEIVRRLLDDYVRGNDAGTRGKLKGIVEKHVRTLRFAMRVEKFLSPLCFVEFIGCTFNIVLIGYYFITEWEKRNAISTMTYCTLLVSFTFNIFIFCYIGEILTEQCKKVGESTYEIDWYKLPGKKAEDIKLIMIISSCFPARITAGKMVYLSMASFSNVIKTAFSYLNMLRTLIQ